MRAMASRGPRPWQRLGVRVAAGFAAVTLLGVGLVGAVVYQEQKRALETTLGTLLLNIARTGALAIDPALHAEVEATGSQATPAYQRVRATLAAIQAANALGDPIYTLTDFDPVARQARFMVISGGTGGVPGEPYALVDAILAPLAQAFREGVATQTGIYANEHGTWLTAFAPVRDAGGRVFAVLDVDYRVDVYLARLAALRWRLLAATALGGLVAVGVGLLVARRVTGPVSALTQGVARVAAGDLSRAIPVRSADEIGHLTRAFNEMVEGLRQRDFIRDTFGRYVSPEIARAVLESPEGLRLGGEKREVTILMSDLRGYTRFAEQSDATVVVQVLNRYLGRMAEIIIEHGGAIDEFIGDAIFALFGAPVVQPDHAERAVACALAMQLAMEEVNRANTGRGLPHLEMGIGLNSGEAVVGNIGSEKRTKYGVVGSAVNLAARVEACTVGGQVLLSPSTYQRVRDLVEVAPPFAVEVKGVKEPLLLHEVRAIRGHYPRRLPETESEAGPEAPVDLPLSCWVIEGKAVRPDPVPGEVRRLGMRRLDAHLAEAVAPLTDVRLRIRYPELNQDSADLYGKVRAAEVAAGGWRVQIDLTSVDPSDRQILESLLRDSRARA